MTTNAVAGIPRLTVEVVVGDKVEHLHGTVLSPEGRASMLKTQLLQLAKIARAYCTECAQRRWMRRSRWRRACLCHWVAAGT
jgi:hypothetical protein